MARSDRVLRRALARARAGDREPISWLVRAYIAILCARHLGFAWALFEGNFQLRRSSGFRYVFDLAPISTWALIFAGVGVLAGGAVFWPRELGVRALLSVSVGISLAFAGGSILALVNQPPTATSLVPIAFGVFAAKDLIVSGMAFTNPVEDMVYRDEHDPPGAGSA